MYQTLRAAYKLDFPYEAPSERATRKKIISQIEHAVFHEWFVHPETFQLGLPQGCATVTVSNGGKVDVSFFTHDGASFGYARLEFFGMANDLWYQVRVPSNRYGMISVCRDYSLHVFFGQDDNRKSLKLEKKTKNEIFQAFHKDLYQASIQLNFGNIFENILQCREAIFTNPAWYSMVVSEIHWAQL
jgi:hypothetical protein